MSEKQKEQKQQQPDPLHAEAQLYQRIEAARAQIAGAVNKTMQDTGLPTAIILELLRGIVAETSLMLERAAGTAAIREAVEKAAAEAEAAAAKAGGAEKEKASGDK